MTKRKTAKASKPKRPTQREFEMEQFEKQAEREAAWGMYARHVGQQNFLRERTQLQRDVATSYGSDARRKVAKEKLAEFNKRTRQSAGMLMVGSGAGKSVAIGSNGEIEDFD